MKVILIEDIPALGDLGAIVEVRPGYGRNYLIPQGKALEATPANVSQFEKRRARLEQLKQKENEQARGMAARLEELSLTITQRAGEGERLYGSVTTTQIAEALAQQGVEVDRKKIELAEPIKTLGVYEAVIRLGSDVKATVKVAVVPEAE